MKKIFIGAFLLFGAAAFGLSLFFARQPVSSLESSLPNAHNAEAERTETASKPNKPLASTNSTPKPRFPIADDGTIEMPLKFRLPGVEKLRTAANTRDWMALYPAIDQERIKRFSDRYHGVYDISSAQQIAWMAQNGYPMPEDIIVAQGMSDKELHELSKNGNEKASLLLHDRLQTRVEERQSKLDMSKPEDLEIQTMLSESNFVLASSPSAFKGFVEAAEALKKTNNPDEQKARLIAGLMRADALGDRRAFDILSSFGEVQYGGWGILSETELAIAAHMAMDAQLDRTLIPNENCPQPYYRNFIPD